jgi:diguanylate cyclase (GGDEF)-like protein/PAS domain S-box-containing protein
MKSLSRTRKEAQVDAKESSALDPPDGGTTVRMRLQPWRSDDAPPPASPHPAPPSQSPELAEGDIARMLKTLLGNLDGMVYRSRIDPDWTMEFVSEGCVRVTGYEPGDLLLNNRISYESITHGQDRERVRRAIYVALTQGKRFDVEYRIHHADSSVRWVWERGVGLFDADGSVIAIEGIIQDITERELSSQSLREAERRYHSLFDNAIEGIFRTSPAGKYLDANPALARIYGFDSIEDLMASLGDIRRQLYVDPGRREEFMSVIRVRGSVAGFESEVYRKDGSTIWISENARAVFDAAGNVQHYEGTVEDITERKRYQARIEQQANYDELTGLANRALLKDRLQQSILTAATYGTNLAVAFVDLDRFKYINDSLGHQVGDQLLKEMAARLKSCVREWDTVARLGGDEFVLLFNGTTGSESVQQAVERMLTVVAQPWATSQGEFQITSSIGVAVYPNDGADAETLLKHADAAMYRAKDMGRNAFQFFTAEFNAQMTARLELEGKLRRALEREQLLLHFQPRVDLTSGRLLGAEALLRWQIPGEPMILPSRFIPLAEETGLIVTIGRWVLQAACAQNKAWQDAGLPPIAISVNVSTRQFMQDSFVDVVAEVLRETGLEPQYLELEITESMVMHDAERLMEMLDQLKALGIQIALDDFGTGYSSLNYLKRFAVDRLKIDRSFVKDVTVNADDAAIVRTIIALGHNLGLKVIAEGVETQAQLAFLRRNLCDEMQGYFFSAPLGAGQFETLLRSV